MLLKNASALIGKELRYVESTNIKIVRGRFGRIGTEIHAGASETSIDCEGLLVMPGMVNAHTHIGDSIGKDIALGASVDSRVHPVHGVKSRILAETNPEHLVTFMLASCKSMIKNGITTFVDFREGGLDGVNLLRKAVSESPIRAIILGRLDLYQNRQEIRQNRAPAIGHVRDLEELLKKCDGVGISGANEHSDATLRAYSKAPKPSVSNMCENGPCPISCNNPASFRMIIFSESIAPFSARAWPAIPATCITPSECSNLVCCAPGYTRCVEESCLMRRSL